MQYGTAVGADGMGILIRIDAQAHRRTGAQLRMQLPIHMLQFAWAILSSLQAMQIHMMGGDTENARPCANWSE